MSISAMSISAIRPTFDSPLLLPQEHMATGKVQQAWKGFTIAQNLMLVKLEVKQRTLLAEGNGEIHRLPEREKEALKKEMNGILSEALGRADIKKLVLENGGKFKFALDKTKGFVLIVGKEEIKLSEYSAFLHEETELNINAWQVFKNRCANMCAISAVELTANQRFFKAATSARSYAEKANLVDRIDLKNSDEKDKKMSEIFQKTVELIKKENGAISAGVLVKHNGKFMNISNIFSLGASAFSASPYTLMVAVFDFIRALGFAAYRSIEFYKAWGIAGKEDIKKYTPFEISYHLVGFIYAAGIFALGLFLAIENFVVKAMSLVFSALAAVWSLWNIINFKFIQDGISELRKELKGFLENTNLNEKEKLRGYLAHLEEKMKLSPLEVEGVKKQVIERESEKRSEYIEKLKKENPSLSNEDAEISYSAYLGEKIDHELKQENRFKIEKLIGMADGFSPDIEEMIKALDSDAAAALEKAKAFIANVDRKAYQNERISIWYKWVCSICFLATILFACLSPVGWPVLAACIFWSAISVLFILLDCQWTSELLFGLSYNIYQEEETAKILGMKKRTKTECAAEITNWKWLKEKTKDSQKIEEVATQAIRAA